MRNLTKRLMPALLPVLALGLLWTSAYSKSSDKEGSGGGGPHIIMIIRHAEKPDTKGDPNLAPRGFERAEALAKVIPAHFPHPDYLFATKRSKDSNRPVETITPLSKVLGEAISSTYKDDETEQFASHILHDSTYAGKTVLIAWHHGEIPKLAKALGVTDAPSKWPSEVFDRVWEITYDSTGAHFQNLPQRALPGDSQN